MSQEDSIPHVVDHLFRHESGKMIAVLSRIFGIQNMQMAEDVVQEAFLKAMQVWRYDTIPENPGAWLMRTARNRAIDLIRRQEHFRQYSRELARQLQDEAENTIDQFFAAGEIADSQLRMIFACCHPALKEEDQVALTLKIASGFGISEIARALMTQEPVIKKRIYRARQFLADHNIELEIPAGDALAPRLETVYTAIYLLFNEGYYSIRTDEIIRRDLCIEAMRLCRLLSEHPAGNKPATHALLALMCLQASRFDSRLDENNDIVLLSGQDRSKWDRQLIHMGYHYLNLSSTGSEISVYHLESGIAAEHCLAERFEDTNWARMLQLYDMLLAQKRTPAVMINRAVVLMQLGRHDEALQEITGFPQVHELVESHYMYCCILGELYQRADRKETARYWFEHALSLTKSRAEINLIQEKLMAV